ncbi:MAG: hypothetical protein M0C28_48820 [Candidatus Moduliflexus flocculans]|nr:hypothetical protein [Candidatus Moduliflexus flocculans]
MSKSLRNYTDPVEVIGPVRGGRPAPVPDATPPVTRRREDLLLLRRRACKEVREERHHPALERLQLLRHLRQHRRRSIRRKRPARQPVKPAGPLDPLRVRDAWSSDVTAASWSAYDLQKRHRPVRGLHRRC